MTQQDKDSHEEILARLRRLEAQNGLMKRIGLLILLIAGALFWMGQAKAIRNVEARKFTLRDPKGKRRAELAVELGRPVLVFYDETEKVSASVGIEEDGPGITLSPGAQQSMVLSATQNGPVMSMFARNGVKRLNLSVAAQGPAIGLLGTGGEARAAFGASGPDNTYLHLFGAKEHGGVQLSSGSDRAVIRVFDSQDKPRAVLGLLEKENTPGLIFNDGGGVSRVRLLLSPRGPGLEFLAGDNNVVWHAP
jgi:hypothetical protein